MKRVWRKALFAALGAAMAIVLSGCVFTTPVEDMLTLPQLPDEYTGLSKQISGLLSDGYEYASPVNGRNIQSVQMIDLNEDGHEEAIVYLRRSSDEKPLKIMVFRPNGGDYSALCTIESSGTAIDSVDYVDLTGDGTKELVVGWSFSSEVQSVAAYEIAAKPVTLMSSGYTRYCVEKLTGDVDDLVVFRADGDNAQPLAELYSWNNEDLKNKLQCSLSVTMAELDKGSIVCGKLNDDIPALFVTGVNDDNRAVTDVIYYQQDEGLNNAVSDRTTGHSSIVETYSKLPPQDINNDGITEVPCLEAEQPGDGVIAWKQYDARGIGRLVETTYHSVNGGWYLRLEDWWQNRIGVANTENGSNERQTTLFLDDVPMVAVYETTGENRENRALLGKRIILKRHSLTVYTGEILSGAPSSVDEDYLRQNFNLIVSAWAETSN